MFRGASFDDLENSVISFYLRVSMYVSSGEKEEAGQELLTDGCRMVGSIGRNMKDSPPSCWEQRFKSVPTTERAQNGRRQGQNTIQDTVWVCSMG